MELSSERSASNIIFVCDLYKLDLNNKGGAENNDSVLIDYLEKSNFKVIKKYCNEITPDYVENNKDSKFIIGNFIGLSEVSKEALYNKHYIIYEHDHKYVKTRDPSRFINMKAPEDQIINKDFYKNSKCVVCLSNIQAECIRKNLNIDNVKSIGSSLWSDEKLNYIESISNNPKQNTYCIVESNNPTKGTKLAEKFCKNSDYVYDLIQSSNEEEFLKIMSTYETLIYIPTVLESLCRLVVEAKMLNCSVITKSNLLGAASEKWWGLKGKELIQAIRNQQENAFKLFLKELEV
jgi:hypothetical protein